MAGKAISWTRVVDFISVYTLIVFDLFIGLLIDLRTISFAAMWDEAERCTAYKSMYLHNSSCTLLSVCRIRSARKGESGGINHNPFVPIVASLAVVIGFG